MRGNQHGDWVRIVGEPRLKVEWHLPFGLLIDWYIQTLKPCLQKHPNPVNFTSHGMGLRSAVSRFSLRSLRNEKKTWPIQKKGSFPRVGTRWRGVCHLLARALWLKKDMYVLSTKAVFISPQLILWIGNPLGPLKTFRRYFWRQKWQRSDKRYVLLSSKREERLFMKCHLPPKKWVAQKPVNNNHLNEVFVN